MRLEVQYRRNSDVSRTSNWFFWTIIWFTKLFHSLDWDLKMTEPWIFELKTQLFHVKLLTLDEWNSETLQHLWKKLYISISIHLMKIKAGFTLLSRQIKTLLVFSLAGSKSKLTVWSVYMWTIYRIALKISNMLNNVSTSAGEMSC